jgi:ribosomal protein L37E
MKGLNQTNSAQNRPHASSFDHKPRVCARCGGIMVIARTIPSFGTLPELNTFMCQACGETSTIIETKSSVVTIPIALDFL